MISSLLVPLDGSSFGEQALPIALSLARRAGARLELVHVHEPLEFPDLNLPALAADNRRAGEQARDYLDDVLQRVSAVSPVKARQTLLEGSVADRLCDFVTAQRIDLIVMASHGRGLLSRFWFGSVATSLVERMPAPVLVVPPGETGPSLEADPAPRRFLIPLDGSPFAEQVIPLAVALGSLTSADYQLLRVVPPVLTGGFETLPRSPAGIGSSTSELLEFQAKDYLRGVVGRVPGMYTARTHVAVDWPTAKSILAYADSHAIDLIAMETHGHGSLGRIFLGSVADKVVRGSTVPVLLHRQHTESPEAR
jgi:nucleotide-binding universal stress UspA family protein